MKSGRDLLADLAADTLFLELPTADASFLHETYEGRRSRGFTRQTGCLEN